MAFSISPSVSDNAFLQSIMPAPVFSRKSFTISAVMAIPSPFLIQEFFAPSMAWPSAPIEASGIFHRLLCDAKQVWRSNLHKVVALTEARECTLPTSWFGLALRSHDLLTGIRTTDS